MNIDQETFSETPHHWYVVRSNNRQEKLARLSLKSEGLETYLPMIIKTNFKGDAFGAPLFPNHLFLRMSLGSSGWTSAFSARGVQCILGCGGRPTAVADRVIRDIQAREADGFVKLRLVDEAPKCRFAQGDAVRVKKGPFAFIDAIFVEPVDSKRVLVLIQLLGESPRIAKADLAQLESRAVSESPVPHLVSA